MNLFMLEDVIRNSQAAALADNPALKVNATLILNPVETRVLLDALVDVLIPSMTSACAERSAEGHNVNNIADHGLFLCRIAERLDAEAQEVIRSTEAWAAAEEDTEIAQFRRKNGLG